MQDIIASDPRGIRGIRIRNVAQEHVLRGATNFRTTSSLLECLQSCSSSSHILYYFDVKNEITQDLEVLCKFYPIRDGSKH